MRAGISPPHSCGWRRVSPIFNAASTASMLRSSPCFAVAPGSPPAATRFSIAWRSSSARSSSQQPTRSQQRAGLLELQPRAAREQLRRIAVSEVAQEVRSDMTLREKLLVAPFALPPGVEELLVDPGIVESGERTAVQPESARRQDQIRALQRGISLGRHFDELRILRTQVSQC